MIIRRVHSQLLVAMAALLFIGSTASPLWVTTVRNFGGWGSLRVYGGGTPWEGYFLPLLLLPAAAIGVAGAVAVLGVLAGRGRRLAGAVERRLFVLLGLLGAGGMVATLWIGPGGSEWLETGSFITRAGVLAYVALPLAGAPLVAALLVGERPVSVRSRVGLAPFAALLALVLVAVGLTFHSTTPRFVATTGPIPDWRTDPNEPYPFSRPVPAQLPTRLDGRYDRPPTENYPDRPSCTRCQPYPLDAGRSTLTLDRGRYRVDHVQPRYRSGGHYVIAGTHITLFNDPECGTTRGVYRFHLQAGVLTLTKLFDPCGFDQRARDLTDAPWQALEG